MPRLTNAVIVAILMLPSSLLNAQRAEVPPPVDKRLIDACQQRMTSDCFADIAWSLAREEKQSFNMGQLAPVFAQLQQWARAEELLARIPNKEHTSSALPPKYVAAERLAIALSSGKVEALKSVTDPLTLSVTASRLLGYLPQESIVPSATIGRRLNHGLGYSRLRADRSVTLALVKHWSSVADASANYLQTRLANAFMLLDETTAARRVAQTIAPNPKEVGRELVELWLRLGEPAAALDAIKIFDPRHRGLYKILVARSFVKQGNVERASAMAMESAADALAADDYERLAMAAEFLSEMKRPDLVKRIAIQGEQRSERPGAFRSFDISAVGEIYGRAGVPAECLRLQAKALGAQGKGAVAWGMVAGPVGYGTGRFDLPPELMQNVATRSFKCGDDDALKQIDNRSLARNYCDLHRGGLFKPEDIDKMPQKRTEGDAPRSLLTASAAECHFERGETAVAASLLKRLVKEAESSVDFYTAHSAAELACVYASQDTCVETLRIAGNVLLKNVEARKLSAQRIAEFAVAWQYRVTKP